jgi:hypothetical protein
VALVPLLLVAGQLGFRLAYYGEWVPNTALVKLQPSLRHMLGGLKYVIHGTLALAPLSLLAGLWLLHGAWHKRPRALLLLLLTGLWLGYVVFVGGDFFAAFRHFLPVLVLLAFALVEASREHGPWLVRQWRTHPRRSLAVLLLGLSTFLLLQRYDSGSRHARAELWEWQGREIALTLKQAFGAEHPLLAVTAAGCLPYWSELPSLDLLGLTDAYIARHPPADFGQGPLAHELGDADYVWSRQPDILCFHLGDREANFPSGRKLQARPDFLSTYVPVTLQLERPEPFEAVLWFRREGAVGIRRSSDEIRVPGFLCCEAPQTRVRLEDNHLVARLSSRQPALLWLAGVDTSWTVQVDSRPRGVVRVELVQEGGRTRMELFTEADGEVSVRGVLLRPALSAAR